MLKRGIKILVLLCCTQIIFAQNTKSDSLNDKIIKNQELFKTNPQKAFKEIDMLLDEGIKLKDAEAELKILSTRYEYDYLLKIDFEQMISSANILKDRAIVHKSRFYEAKSHKYLAQAYAFNELYDKALYELQLGMGVLDDANEDASYIIMEKANIHTAFANVYSLKKEYFSGIQSLLNSVKEHEKLTNSVQKRGTKFMDYANLGGAYLKVNLDSAKFYANKSVKLSTPDEANHNLMFINYLVIGNVHLERKEYDQALVFYKKAEDIKENKYFLNIKELYSKYIQIYDAQGNTELKQEYESKLKDLTLTVTQSQNKSLRKIIKDDTKKDIEVPNGSLIDQKESNHHWVWILTFIVGTGLIIFMIYRRKKKNESSSLLSPESYNDLLTVLKKNDQTFLLAFENEFPDFSQKLLKLASDLSNSEIEILAMIKLGLTNKEIATYKFIQHKTVQNKRHIIRKKLNFAQDKDLNKWVESL